MPTLPFSTPVRHNLLTVSEAVVALTGLVDGMAFVYGPDFVGDALARIHGAVRLWEAPDPNRSVDEDQAVVFAHVFKDLGGSEVDGNLTQRVGTIFWAHCRSLQRITERATLREAVGHHVAALVPKRS